MMNVCKFLLPFSILAASGCSGPNLDYEAAPTTHAYTEPSSSGLHPIRPYPNPDDVCQVIKEDATIREPVDNGSLLIACPKHEEGAIEDRLNEGATVISHAKHWTILSVNSIL